MPSLKNVFFSCPSSPPHSLLSSGRPLGSTRQLTRQHKYRHATESDLGLQPIEVLSKSLPVSPKRGSPSPNNVRHWSVPALPQPLPLPQVSSSSSVTTRKSTDYVASKSSRVPTYHRKGFHPENAGKASSFRLDVPARSAPTSGFSSPAVSPQRFGSVDVLHFSYSVPREFKISMDRNVVSTSYVLPERFLPSPDRSPLQSPILPSPHKNIRNRHYKSLPGSPVAWPEGYNSNVHPLPRPPGEPSPSHLLNMSRTRNESSTEGQWQKEKLIGRGTYGSVYVAINCNNGAMCAMKEVDVIPSDSKSAECIKQLEQEIRVLQQLDHPNIVQYLGSDIIEDRFCIYLEYVHPGSINNYVREHYRSVTESVVRSFTRHILTGLAYLHSTNTIHRDIKGANLLVNASGVVKLADFGLAKHLTSYAVDLSLKGSPHWMAPEVQAMFNVLNRSLAIPETLSAEGKDFLGRCFQRNPEDRPTAAMLLDHPFLSNSQDQNRCSSRKLHNVLMKRPFVKIAVSSSNYKKRTTLRLLL
ncbi:Protein kinase domain-containing protein [Heracleum sosnowskyi]|uniref:mitogen-activated protein kinase kinase kinase n=1 Tax=Heracleum sosnowskyi TaxID=360622 RepID=A0AAD8JLY7_9APIA|nr:Protein kinase domain-containing protein [Heracleum sosnowskyi]